MKKVSLSPGATYEGMVRGCIVADIIQDEKDRVNGTGRNKKKTTIIQE